MDVEFVMFKENGERKNFTLRNQSTTIGRQEDCDIRIPLPEVSRQHAEVKLTRHGVQVKDLGSSNGTYVNNRRVREKELDAGDHLVIGPVVFTVQIDGQPSDIRPVKTKVRRTSVFSPEDDLTTGIEPEEADLAAQSFDPTSDSEVMQALEASGEGSSMHIELDELDLGDSVFTEDKE